MPMEDDELAPSAEQPEPAPSSPGFSDHDLLSLLSDAGRTWDVLKTDLEQHRLRSQVS